MEHVSRNNTGRAAPAAPSREQEVEEWEVWEDEEMVTPIENDEQILIHDPPSATIETASAVRYLAPSTSRIPRQSSSKIKRLKSRQRQKAQNAKAGIKVITDMTAFKRQPHTTYQLRTPDGRPIKFVDAAALKALEGEPNSASVGNWNWLKKNKGQSPAAATPKTASTRTPDNQLSPEDRPIVIGIALPSGEVVTHEVSPHTTTLNTPHPLPSSSHEPVPQAHLQPNNNQAPTPSTSTTQHQISVWSPDTPTPDTASSYVPSRTASSVYSQVTIPRSVGKEDVPPVPAVPATFKKDPKRRLISLELNSAVDESDGGTPCTLFEEDGIPSPLKQARSKQSGLTPDSAGSRSHGWWDHVVTPFADKHFTFTSRKQQSRSPREERSRRYQQQQQLEDDSESCHSASSPETPGPSPPPKPSPLRIKAPIVKAPTPRRSPPPRENITEHYRKQSRSSSMLSGSTLGEKPRIIITDDAASDYPPPYSPPKRNIEAPVRYRAVFPPGHPLQSQFPPSPGPGSPGLAATMSSQGATQMMEIPLTPSPLSHTQSSQSSQSLPTRPVGTRLPREHAHSARGRVHKVERSRRRHEKEDVAARRAGGLWRGRGCLPKKGCFGRSGREGRKKRRCCMALWGLILALIILGIVLGVVLSRPHKHKPIPSIWVNLTDFPPMPTGVLTMVGPDNTEARTICTNPSTVWSCSLPFEQHASVAPYNANQPTVIFEIQWDNSTAASWNVSGGDPPVPAPVSRRSSGAAAMAGELVREKRSTDGFQPNPAAPTFQDMWFMGETTDGIVSSQKAGEPTPFFISILSSVDDTVAAPGLNTRDIDKRNGSSVGGLPLNEILPQPDLLSDGTPAPAVMIPQPVQQPVRLFDRGLPTEHYGFYSSFDRTIFLESVTALNSTDDNPVAADENGGCAKTDANFLATWGQARVLVQIWTRKLDNTTTSLLDDNGSTGIGGSNSPQLVRPGTMPWPITVSLDTHGGNPNDKITWEWPMDSSQKLNLNEAKLLENNMGAGGTWINHRGSGDTQYGGFDGGTGGCKCEWVNWV